MESSNAPLILCTVCRHNVCTDGVCGPCKRKGY